MDPLPYRLKLWLAFAGVVAMVALVNGWAGFSLISGTLVKEAKLRVEMDLGTAWDAFEDEKERLQTVAGMASQRESLRPALRGEGARAVSADLEALRRRYELDFLTLVDPAGVAIARSRSPFATGDTVARNAVLARALAGQADTGTILLSPADLAREGEGLAERAFIPVVYTERAAPAARPFEDRGMVLLAAFPILDSEERVLGALYGGVLLNRKFELVDRIRDTVFGDRTLEGRPVGTVTLFLGDVRIATNVMLDAGTRALGTRVSREVGEQVLARGERFADRAFVVNDWYLSAYEPIRDPEGQIVGIIYVGLLEKSYLGYKVSLASQFLIVSLLALLAATGVAHYLSGGFRRPLQRLLHATRELSKGDLRARVHLRHASRELVELAGAFNSMAESLEGHRRELEEAHSAMQLAYLASEERNRAYLEMLGFVTHELKSPLASIVFAIASLRERLLGPLNGGQEALLKSAANSADYLHDTIANYLNLARIEEGDLRLRASEVRFAQDVVDPVVHRLGELASEKNMRIVSTVDPALLGAADPYLLTSVVQNLLSNAIKYGREGGEIRIACRPAADGTRLAFSVWNEGRGFPRGAGERLFQKFGRLGRGGVDTKTGTGLGLFVSRKIIEKHGGRIWAESEPDQWAEFTFELPIAPGSTLADPDGEPEVAP